MEEKLIHKIFYLWGETYSLGSFVWHEVIYL